MLSAAKLRFHLLIYIRIFGGGEGGEGGRGEGGGEGGGGEGGGEGGRGEGGGGGRGEMAMLNCISS